MGGVGTVAGACRLGFELVCITTTVVTIPIEYMFGQGVLLKRRSKNTISLNAHFIFPKGKN